MDLVDAGFYGVLIFRGIIWAPLAKDGIFELGDVSFDIWFLCILGVLVSIPSSDPVGTGSSILIHLGLVPHGDDLNLDSFFVIMLR